MILFPNIIHHFSPKTAIDFFRKAASISSPGARLIISDMVPPPGPFSLLEGPNFQRAFKLVMLVWSKSGTCYTGCCICLFVCLFVFFFWSFHVVTNWLFDRARISGHDEGRWMEARQIYFSFPSHANVSGRCPRLRAGKEISQKGRKY